MHRGYIDRPITNIKLQRTNADPNADPSTEQIGWKMEYTRRRRYSHGRWWNKEVNGCFGTAPTGLLLPSVRHISRSEGDFCFTFMEELCSLPISIWYMLVWKDCRVCTELKQKLTSFLEICHKNVCRIATHWSICVSLFCWHMRLSRTVYHEQKVCGWWLRLLA